MKKYLIILSFILSFGCKAEKPPNIVVIMADDIGLGDVSHHVRTFMNREPIFETPAIDSLARDGMWFTDGHSATSLCSPTRYCVMTGKNNYHSVAPWGVWNSFSESPIKPTDQTISSILKKANYSTGFIGKWHLGGDFKLKDSDAFFRESHLGVKPDKIDLTKMVGGGPQSFDFDYSFTLPCGIQGPLYLAYEKSEWYRLSKKSKIVYLNNENSINPDDLTSKGPGPGDSYWNAKDIGKIISKKAVEFINYHAKKEPFFLYYCSPMPHKPHCPPEYFDGKKVAGTTPSVHLDCVVDLDCQINRIILALKQNDIYENTLIIFMSDNGGLPNISSKESRLPYNSSGGYSGAKNSPLEGGHRVPFIAVWPQKIKPNTVSHELVVNTDLLATFASLVNRPLSDEDVVDSNNLMPLFINPKKYQKRNIALLQAGSNCEVLYRKEGYKLIIQSDWNLSKWNPVALYDLNENKIESPQNNKIYNKSHKLLVDTMLHEYLDIRNSKKVSK